MNTRQRKQDLVKGALVVGVDIGKLKNFAAIRFAGSVLEILGFNNDLQGFKHLADEVEHWGSRLEVSRFVLGLEPTGHYWHSLAYWWEENKGPVVLVNPMHTKRVKELEDNSPLKCDSKDGVVISGLVSEAKFLECHLPRGVFATLRNLNLERTRCRKRESQLMNQLHQSVERIFPEIERAFSKLSAKSCRELLLFSADPAELSKFDSTQLGERLRKWSRGRLGTQRAETIIALAGDSVGVKEGKEAVNAEIKRLILNLGAAEQQRLQVEAEIRKCLKQTPGAALLLSVPDFGPMTVAGIVANTGDLTSYQNPNQVIKLAGINLYEISSGQHKGQPRITKRARSQFRQILYMAALRASRKSGSFHYSYARLRARGVPPTSALVAIMRKILRISWALVSKEREFDKRILTTDLPMAA